MAFKHEKRNDVAVGLSRKTLGGVAKLLASIIFPIFRVSEVGGKLSVAQQILGTGTKNRTAGDSLTGTRITTKEIDYSCDKYEDRARLSEREVKLLGGEQNAINSGARTASYGVMKQIEAEAAATVFTTARYSAAYTSTTAAPFKGIADAAKAVKRFGEPHLFCSESWLANFVAIPAVATTLKDLLGQGVIASLLGYEEKIMAAVGIVFGVKAIHVGDDDFWNISGKTDAAVVIAIRPEIVNDVISGVKMQPCYGFAPEFLPEDGTEDAPFSIDTDWDSAAKDNLVDASQEIDVKELNADGAVLIKLPADVTPTCATPVFSPVAGEVDSGDKVIITSSTADVNIRYTSNGSTPSATAGTLYDPLSDGIAITAGVTLKAIAYRTGYNNSAVASAAYTVAT